MSSSPARICMNGLCGATTTPQWKKGWAMKTGGFATLCYSCGVAYEKVNYCERFHLNEPGWRECKFCDTPIHCGCIVSQYLHEYLDSGGITCVKCLPAKETQPLKQSIVNGIPNGFARFSGTWHPSIVNNSQMNNNTSSEKGKLMQLNEAIDKHQHARSSSFSHQFRQDENPFSSREFVTCFTSSKDIGAIASIPVPQQSLGSFLGASNFSNGALEGRVEEKIPAFKEVQKSRIMFPKLLKSGVSIRSQANKGMGSDTRVSRPLPDGLGRSQLLPRYWPKITDQELLQISGDLNSNCTITPLFEKVLSASDAGRIGRLVLPKACAEAYFPTINQSEGLPIKIRDIKGKEWTFQFRFWPNNNSRMYVLEGVTPCIQNMQLQAGDTVIFSRLDPEDQLIIGFRKAIISAEDKVENSALPKAVNGGTPISVGNENPPTNNMEHEKKKKMRNIGSKSKRLHMHSDDAMELKMTWQEAQEFLRPSPSSNPTVEIIEDCEFEEFDEPPVFGKKTIFTMTATGLQEQWVQCDSCSKRRKLASDVLVPPKWTCSNNVSDPDRSSCSAPEERRVADLARILRFSYESKKRKLAKSRVSEEPQQEATGLDALATVAVLGETIGTTTRHPRHRPGCSCIVCIQPPSGKGKHKPTCICNVCLTVKRRFKTLMQRRQKREAENAEKSLVPVIDGMESVNGIGVGIGFESSNKGQELDLNCDPKEEETMLSIECQNVLTGLVPKGTSDGKNDNKVVDLGI